MHGISVRWVTFGLRFPNVPAYAAPEVRHVHLFDIAQKAMLHGIIIRAFHAAPDPISKNEELKGMLVEVRSSLVSTSCAKNHGH